jgi:uncharacterized protein YjbI with pentapeptide repeats
MASKKWFTSSLKWLLLDFSGVRLVWRKIKPPFEPSAWKRQPSTFLLWSIAIYAAFFGITSQRYENTVDVIETRANAIFAQLSSPDYKKALSRISRVQNMKCPQKPEFLKPCSVFSSLIGNNSTYEEIVVVLRDTLEMWKTSLTGVNLEDSDLRGADFQKADFEGTNLQNADLEGANLKEANLKGANLRCANLRKVNLEGADLTTAILVGANLLTARLTNANFSKANLAGAVLWKDDKITGSKVLSFNYTLEQLSTAESLLGTGLYPKHKRKLMKDHPELFKEESTPLPSAPGIGEIEVDCDE